MSALERRYRRLLRAYPGWYLADRGEEMLGTVLEADTRGRAWPSAREAKTLIMGGLRVRGGQGERLGMAASLRQVGLFAAVLIASTYAAINLATLKGRFGGRGFPFPPGPFTWVGVIIGLLTLIAMTAVWPRWRGWPGWRAVARVIALVTAGLWVYQPPTREPVEAIGPVLALVLIAILGSGAVRLPRSWFWLAAVLFAGRELSYLTQAATVPYFTAFLAVIVGTIAWSVVDARPLAAVAVWYCVVIGLQSIQALVQVGLLFYWGLSVPLIISIAVSTAAVWRLRRQAVL